MKRISLFFFKIANEFYLHFFSLYKPLYFCYKKVSDKDIIAWLSERIQPGLKWLTWREYWVL